MSKPWHQVVQLRDELKNGELALNTFAADLYDVVMGNAKPIYQEVDQFFSFTYPTYTLRELAKDVVLRLAGRNDKTVRQLELTYGGGKTHTLITLYHLTKNPSALPALPAVQEFTQHIGLSLLPQARIAVLAFDKLDVESGMDIQSYDGEIRKLKHPWSILAFQLAGSEGLRLLNAEGKDEERISAPAEPLLVQLLSIPVKQGFAPLILIDEVLMYVRGKVGIDPEWRNRLIDFFQYLTQAATKVPNCAIVASLLATDTGKSDTLGKELTQELYAVFRREKEEAVQPVLKEDVAEVLRRRFFKPESIHNLASFRPHILPAVQGIADLDDQTQKDKKNVEARFLQSYPFHPDLTEVLYAKWTQQESFQRTRGVLRTFAVALRDAAQWDTNALVATNVFLSEPGKASISEAARELINVAETEEYEGKRQEWTGILEGELAKAREIQAEIPVLRYREAEQAVFATFLHSQPVGKSARIHDLMVLLGHNKPDKIALEKALRRWTELSWFLDEAAMEGAETSPSGGKLLPHTWRLGGKPNLRQMHHDAALLVSPEIIEARLLDAIRQCRSLTEGVSAAGAKPHTLPEHPNDMPDDGEFRYGILGPNAASSPGRPSEEAKRFITENTGSNNPRVYRNAILLVVPSKEGVVAARNAIRDHQGWSQVKSQLKGQDIDSTRKQLLDVEEKKAERLVTELVKQAYNVVVTVSDKNEIHAFRVVLRDNSPLFTLIKNDKQARIQETAVTAASLLPDGPYDLWREGDTTHYLKDLTYAFAKYAQLPKMLNRKAILDTLLKGCADGLFVLESTRGDSSRKTYWFEAPEANLAAKDDSLQVILSQYASLSDIPAQLLVPDKLPELWHGPELALRDVYTYFSSNPTVTLHREKFDDEIVIPQADRNAVDAAIATAVKEKRLWLLSGRASLFAEDVPADVLVEDATLQAPPQPLHSREVMPDALPEAWNDKEETTALAISDALATKTGKALPWITVRDAIDAAFKARWLERTPDSPLLTDYAGARGVKISTRKEPSPTQQPKPLVADAPTAQYAPTPETSHTVAAEATLASNQLQDLNDIASELLKETVECGITFKVRIELGSKARPSAETIEKVNTLLQDVSKHLKLM